MWKFLAHFILQNRLILLSLLVLGTLWMGYQGKKAELSYEFAIVVPPDDPDFVFHQSFLKTFGKDDNVFVIGVQDSSLYKLESFQNYQKLVEELAKINGVFSVIGIPNLAELTKNQEAKKFDSRSIFNQSPASQSELDSLMGYIRKIKFYEGQIYNPNTGATLLVVAVDPLILNSPKRKELLKSVDNVTSQFENNTKIKLHYAGIPFVRVVTANKVQAELNFFLAVSIGITALTLFLFFRSFSAVVYPLILIGIVVVWTLGIIGTLEYKISMLLGLLPSILVVIGIPNCIYLLNKYHQEYLIKKDKKAAMEAVVEKIGIVTLITNLTTAIGFAVLHVTEISILKEFGTVAALGIVSTFIISLIFIPSVFSFLPAPQERHTRHLEFTPVKVILSSFEKLIFHHRGWVYSCMILLTIISIIGVYRVKTESFMVDDLPEDGPVKTDLRFFEKHFDGVMPLEIVIDLGKKNAVRKLSNLVKIDSLQSFLEDQKEISKGVSLVSFVKASNQAYYNQDSSFYTLPSKRESVMLMKYLGNQSDTSGIQRSFVDSTGQVLRLSMKIADIGSIKIKDLIENRVQPKIDEIFGGTDIKVSITGTTLIFVKGNRYLIQNLKSGLFLACVIIAIIMGLMFKNLRMILISLIPNIIPLLVTAGIMGYFGISLKPSTVLIFSIAFGISVDDTIHFLAKYKQELLRFPDNRFVAIGVSLRETGMSMIYTSLVLFFGFVIFVASDFGGTIALGALTSTTLLIAMFANLVLLPSLLVGLNTRKIEIPSIEINDSLGEENPSSSNSVDTTSNEISSEKVDPKSVDV